jgi:Mor family transcriptional regulator
MRKRRDMAIYNRFVSDPSRLMDLAKEYDLTTKRTIEIINKYHHIVYGVLDDE